MSLKISPLNHGKIPIIYGFPKIRYNQEFPYGWRYVTETLPNGDETYHQIPLTASDILDPQLGDVMPQNSKHYRTNVDLSKIS